MIVPDLLVRFCFGKCDVKYLGWAICPYTLLYGEVTRVVDSNLQLMINEIRNVYCVPREIVVTLSYLLAITVTHLSITIPRKQSGYVVAKKHE